MPKMNGLEAMEAILKIDSTVKVIFISADDSVENKVKESGAFGFVSKPFRINPLLETIKGAEG